MVNYPIPMTFLEADTADAASGEGEEQDSDWQ
jgi:hypothetical protein